MCVSTRFPEATPLKNIKAQTIVQALTKFFTLVGLPNSGGSSVRQNILPQLILGYIYILKYLQSNFID